jgi:hypothetical protein
MWWASEVERRKRMDFGERTTGTRDEQYNLIAVLYHALHGTENCEIYAMDAEAAGRDEHAAFFREAQAMQRDLAERAKGLLGVGGGVIPGEAGGAMPGTAPLETEVPPESVTTPPDAAPPTDVVPPPDTPRAGGVVPGAGDATVGRDVPPDTAPGDIPPRSADIQRESKSGRTSLAYRRSVRRGTFHRKWATSAEGRPPQPIPRHRA